MIVEVNSNDNINWNAKGYDRIADNVANILKTKIAEVPYMRGMGISSEYIDSPINDIKGHLISDSINAISTYEPRASVTSIDIIDADTEGNLTIKVVIEI